MIKKIIPYILILIIFVGLLGPMEKAHAEAPSGTCTYTPPGSEVPTTATTTEKKCTDAPPDGLGGTWKTMEASSITPTNNTNFQQAVADYECGIGSTFGIGNGTIKGCVLWFFYAIYYAIPAFFLWMIAYVFNVLIYVSLGSALFKDAFVGNAWAIVRDLSNIFFILILLYIAIKLILGLGGHEVKKMIAKVIIIALLINFSMFFTGVIIDSSNILALVFYNKLTTIKKVDGTEVDYPSIKGEKDVASAMVANFDPTTTLSDEFFTQITKIYTGESHQVAREMKVPIPLLIAIILFAGSLLYYVCIVLAIAALAFLVRIIELWVLIIFSPFAFMSSTIPKLAGIEYIGWEAWFKRLIKTSFMAPIFMFFLYFIFMLIKSNLFINIIPKSDLTSNTNAASVITYLLGILLPLVFIEVLLYKATRFAVSSSGKVGEMAMTGIKAIGGIALSAATGGVTSGIAAVGTKTLGRGAAAMAGSEGLKTAAKEGGFGGFMAKMALKAGNYGQKASFDIKNTGAFKSAEKASGLNLSRNVLGLGPKQGGFKEAGERRAAELKKESELYKTTKSDKEVQDWSKKNEMKNSKGEYYTSANELNNERMRAFRDKVLMGSNGLLGAAAYSFVKRTGGIIDKNNATKDDEYNREHVEKHGNAPFIYDPKIGDEINRKRVNNTKMVIGGTAAAVLTGGVAGIAGAGTGAMAMAGTAGGGAGVYASTPSAAERKGEAKFSKELEKDIEKMSKVTDRIAENTKSINELKDIISKGNDLIKDDEEKPVTLIREDGSIDTEKIEEQLARLITIDKDNERDLKKLRDAGHTRKDNTPEGEKIRSLLNEGISSITMQKKLNKLKDAPKELHKLNTENLSLADRQHKLEEAQKPPADKPKGGGSALAPKGGGHGKEEKHEEHPAPAPAPSGGGESKPAGGGGGHGH